MASLRKILIKKAGSELGTLELIVQRRMLMNTMDTILRTLYTA